MGLVILHEYTPVEFTIIKSRAMTLSRSLQCRAFSWAVMVEKYHSVMYPKDADQMANSVDPVSLGLVQSACPDLSKNVGLLW